jgi:hypothetical protein
MWIAGITSWGFSDGFRLSGTLSDCLTHTAPKTIPGAGPTNPQIVALANQSEH